MPQIMIIYSGYTGSDKSMNQQISNAKKDKLEIIDWLTEHFPNAFFKKSNQSDYYLVSGKIQKYRQNKSGRLN